MSKKSKQKNKGTSSNKNASNTKQTHKVNKEENKENAENYQDKSNEDINELKNDSKQKPFKDTKAQNSKILVQNSIELPNESRWKKILSILGVIIALSGVIIGYLALDHSKKEAELEAKFREEEERAKSHEDFKLRLDCFYLESNVDYNIDLVVPPDCDVFSLSYIFDNQGKYDAKNIFFSLTSDMNPEVVMTPVEAIKDTIMICSDTCKKVEVKLEYISPKWHMACGLFFVPEKRKNEQKFKNTLILYCENKKNTISIDIYYTLYNFSLMSDYATYLYEKSGNDDKYNQYMRSKDFVIQLGTTVKYDTKDGVPNTTMQELVYKINKKENNGFTTSLCENSLEHPLRNMQ